MSLPSGVWLAFCAVEAGAWSVLAFPHFRFPFVSEQVPRFTTEQLRHRVFRESWRTLSDRHDLISTELLVSLCGVSEKDVTNLIVLNLNESSQCFLCTKLRGVHAAMLSWPSRSACVNGVGQLPVILGHCETFRWLVCCGRLLRVRDGYCALIVGDS
jgi:hypothetical protein